ncbi:MAG: hypothetical protein AAB876_01905 [Patescibacteria group bacterium]
MIGSLPQLSFEEYHRDFSSGTLRKFFSEFRPDDFEGKISLSLRYRKIVGIRIFRGRYTGGSRKNYTYLPQFIAPHKWYSYFEIDLAMKFIHKDEFTSISKALDAWDGERDTRICDGKPPGPCRTTVYNWYKAFGKSLVKAKNLLNDHKQRESGAVNSEKIIPEINNQQTGLTTPNDAQRPETKPDCKQSKSRSSTPVSDLLAGLRAFGASLFSEAPTGFSISFLGLGLWALEGWLKTPCLICDRLAGTIVLIGFPEVELTSGDSLRYFFVRKPP